MKSARFEVYQDKKKGWRFRLVAANGRIIAQGESHSRKADAWRAVETLVKTAPMAKYGQAGSEVIEVTDLGSRRRSYVAGMMN